ncbi:hypothetical protein VHEMI05932 [[Torrubiella] hemipterigena]|uniref:Zn(2)-C6 fungal-type domain-containing protein n=1 Tax=[Torrubiella] hemipterigena TaxID=1531966 RepID=A0A0A1TI74_9HYPO|nr:hypothetical protein VHEMI05932 [[Torrubiella] hemipterigena]
MHLKRGSEREACDFCHRRKIKCDRALIAKAGHASPTCTACEIRSLDCQVDDSNDVRIQRKRRQKENHPAPAAAPAAPDPRHPSPQAPSAAPGLSGYLDPEPWFSSSLFDLSSENILFLNQVFTGDYTFDFNGMADAGSTIMYPVQIPLPGQDVFADLWGSSGVDGSMVLAALEAYFALAWVSLPIVSKEAFWTDYHAGQCSPALLFAIAACGVVYTDLEDSVRWDMQQKLAYRFKSAFLESQNGGGDIRLDDIEALALMVEFEYDESRDPSGHGHLDKMYLSHESLVLLTLRYQGTVHRDSLMPITRLEERRILLFWHVFGLDAFRCLDKRTMSRIPDDYDTSQELLPERTDATNYLEAVLSLAVIARDIFKTLCPNACRRNGIKAADVYRLYEVLKRWRATSWAPYLERRTDSSGRLIPYSFSGANEYQDLQRLVLWSLETNCYMQIESCADAFGLASSGGLDAEAAAMRIEYESMQAAQDAVRTVEWMEMPSNQTSLFVKGRHPVDLARMVQQILAGVCTWLTIRGQRRYNSLFSVAPFKIHGNDDVEDASKTELGAYSAAIATLRGAVAKGTSQRGSAGLFQWLDGKIGAFQSAVNP